jgi:hypothetical protein
MGHGCLSSVQLGHSGGMIFPMLFVYNSEAHWSFIREESGRIVGQHSIAFQGYICIIINMVLLHRLHLPMRSKKKTQPLLYQCT